MTPSLVRQTVLGPDTPPVVVMSWALEVDWLEDSSAPNPETIRTYHLGVAVLQSQDGFLGLPQPWVSRSSVPCSSTSRHRRLDRVRRHPRSG